MRRRRLLVAAAATLTTFSLLSAVPVEAAPAPAGRADEGTLVIKMLDERGKPESAAIAVFGEGPPLHRVATVFPATGLRKKLPPGRYGVSAFTNWGGFQCPGLKLCAPASELDITTRDDLVDGSVKVVAGETTTVTVREDTPATISGRPTVGRTLRVAWSSSMSVIVDFYPYSAPTVAWLRNGREIKGATKGSYALVDADAGKAVSVRLTWSKQTASDMKVLFGSVQRSRTTAAVKVRG